MIKNGTWKAEPASEDGWHNDEISDPETFDTLYEYTEDQYHDNFCARPVAFNGVGI